MKIGYFIAHFPYKERLDEIEYFKRYAHGGAEISAYYLAITMAKRGHKVKVFTTSISPRNSFYKCDNIETYRYGINFRTGKGYFSSGLFLKPLKYDVDIIHSHLTFSLGDLAALWYAKIKKKTPFVLTYHGDAHQNYGSLIRRMGISFYNNHLVKKFLSSAKVIISPSKWYVHESRFLREYKYKTVVIPNGINLEDFNVLYSKKECREKLGLPIDKNIVLFVGSLIQYKGPDVLLRALPKIIEVFPDTLLVFVGDGRMRRELAELSKKLSVDRYVKSVGFAKESFKPLYYEAADLFVLPSTMSTESFGVVNLEAMASGLPIVASKIGGIPDLVKDHENGLLVPPRDSDALADSITLILKDQDLKNKMSEDAQRKVKHYSWEKIAEKTERIYEKVLNHFSRN